MAIHTPGYRKHKKSVVSGNRSAVATLSLTAMVDMFTVLVVFLLQNYAVTGEFIQIDKSVDLPNAATVKQLKPSNVVVVSNEKISLNDELTIPYNEVKGQKDWMIQGLREKIEQIIEKGEKEKKSIKNRIKQAVQNANDKNIVKEEDVDAHRKITIQADKQIDFLTVKKVMYTATEAGMYEINFAVLKKDKKSSEAL